jgi:hypothetical protein
MANPWFRLWTDMVNDPKWRTIARKSGQKIGDVIAVALHMMTCASNATERGHIEGWNDEDVATALDIDTEQVEAIREAMQGRVLDGEYLTGWEKRQPLREREDDTAADRKRRQREREAAEANHVTPCHAASHQETPREEEIQRREEKKEPKSKAESATASRLPADWEPSAEEVAFCVAERPDLIASEVAMRFRDYWIAQPGAKGRKTDWPATWRNWVRNERVKPAARASPGGYESAKDKSRREASARLTGRTSNDERSFIDIN